MPNTREKLIDLLEEIACRTDDERCQKCEEQDCVRCAYENVADHLIANGVTVQKWIPVTERLPEPLTIVFIWDSTNKRVTDAYMTRHKEWIGISMSHEVTHWMPLPEPPKGD